MAKSRLEQETTISFNAEEPDATCWTANPATVTKWKKCRYEVKVTSTFEGKPSAWVCLIPKELLSFRTDITKSESQPSLKKVNQNAILALAAYRRAKKLKSTPSDPNLTPLGET